MSIIPDLAIEEGFTSRRHAGRLLAGPLAPYSARTTAVVLALTPESVPVANEVARALGLPLDIFEGPVEQPRIGRLRCGRPALDVAGRTVIVVDDGLAAATSMREAIGEMRRRHAARVIAAAPVGTFKACRFVDELADEVVCLRLSDHVGAVGGWYDEYGPVSDDDVVRLLLDVAETPNKGDEQC